VAMPIVLFYLKISFNDATDIEHTSLKDHNEGKLTFYGRSETKLCTRLHSWII